MHSKGPANGRDGEQKTAKEPVVYVVLMNEEENDKLMTFVYMVRCLPPRLVFVGVTGCEGNGL